MTHKKTKTATKTATKDATKSRKRNKETLKLVINVPIGNKTAEFIDDYNMLDMTIKQAMDLPEFEESYMINCKNTINKRTNTLLENDVSFTRYSNAESNNFCKCSLNKLSKYTIRNLLDKDKRPSIALVDCIKDTINSVKTRLSKDKKNKKVKSKSKT
jgi:hypothetical protein